MEHVGIRPPASDIEPLAIELGGTSTSLLPCLTFYDSTHVCLTSFYQTFIFGGASSRAAVFASPHRVITKVRTRDLCLPMCRTTTLYP